jgi:hypothetical protein
MAMCCSQKMALSEKMPPRQAVTNKKYHDPVYDDRAVEGLMKYFKCGTYRELHWFLQHAKY